MRFKLTLAVDTRYGNKLPINYQYELSAFVYATIYRADAAYSSWLHENGFRHDKKQFRLFSFSHLQLSRFRIEGDRLVIDSPEVSWEISFLPERSTEEFIRGIFGEQVFSIGDKQSQVQFRVAGVELMPEPDFSTPITFNTLSPVCITHPLPDGRTFYESPDTAYARDALLLNLKNKYAAFYGHEFAGNDHFELQILSPPKSKLINIKTGTPQETRVRAYSFQFKLQADVELMKVMWNCGLGEKNAMGFGCVGVRRRE